MITSRFGASCTQDLGPVPPLVPIIEIVVERPPLLPAPNPNPASDSDEIEIIGEGPLDLSKKKKDGDMSLPMHLLPPNKFFQVFFFDTFIQDIPKKHRTQFKNFCTLQGIRYLRERETNVTSTCDFDEMTQVCKKKLRTF